MRISAVAVVGALVGASLAGPAQAQWRPGVGDTLQWQLSGTIDTSVDADLYDVDGFDTPRATVDELHADGRHVICYLSAGSYENWRPDADRFPRVVLGEPLDGWPGERWLDVRRRDLLRPIMEDRVARCARKDFDAVEFDNVDGFSNDSGFALQRADQLRYDRMLARIAHDAGLAVGLKNAPELVDDLVADFDFALVEQCFQYRECARYDPFISAGKPVFVVEYELTLEQFCDRAEERGFSAQRKRWNLGAWRRTCWER